MISVDQYCNFHDPNICAEGLQFTVCWARRVWLCAVRWSMREFFCINQVSIISRYQVPGMLLVVKDVRLFALWLWRLGLSMYPNDWRCKNMCSPFFHFRVVQPCLLFLPLCPVPHRVVLGASIYCVRGREDHTFMYDSSKNSRDSWLCALFPFRYVGHRIRNSSKFVFCRSSQMMQ